VERIGALKMGIMVYVNGYMRGEWLTISNESEEGRRFFPLHYQYFWNEKDRAAFAKAPKKMLTKMKIDPEMKYAYRRYCWGSVDRLKAHFIKHNKDITLLQEDRHDGITTAAQSEN
jgi:hypothetical protein